MRRPTWITVIGILGIIFASFGLFSAVQSIMTPQIMGFQRTMFGQMEDIFQGIKELEDYPIPTGEVFDIVEEMWAMPAWLGTWYVVSGLVNLLLAGFYLFACISLLQMKRLGVRWFYWASGLRLAFAVAELVVGLSAASLMGISLVGGAAVALVAYAVLLLVVIVSDKEAFAVGSPKGESPA